MPESTPLMTPWQFNYVQGNLTVRQDYDGNNNAIYIGWAQPGTLTSEAGWRIVHQFFNSTGLMTQTGFPGDVNGNPSCAFGFVWDNRATYTYS